MTTIKPEIGAIWRYPYLWKWQSDRGETEGRKPRPTALVAVVPVSERSTHLYLLPITGTEPSSDRDAEEIPTIEIRRANLTEYKRLWIIFDEHNRDVLEASFYFEPHARIGGFSRAFIKKMAGRFLGAIRAGGQRAGIDRAD
jgi:hypothetical protein